MASVIPAVTRISPRVIRVLGCNPSRTALQGTNTYIIGTGKRRILIDTGDMDVPQYISYLRSVLQNENIDLAHIILTHYHQDHIGGLNDILEELPEFTRNCEVWKYPRYQDDMIHKDLCSLRDGQEFSVEGATLRVLHTPGHASDHVALHLLEDNAVFSGDCVLGDGPAIIEHLQDFMDSLRVILMVQPEVVYPGHGNIIHSPTEVIQHYLMDQQQKEQQIINVLSKHRKESFTEEDLASVIFTDLSQKQVTKGDSDLATHLHKLLMEDKVRKIDNMWQYNTGIVC